MLLPISQDSCDTGERASSVLRQTTRHTADVQRMFTLNPSRFSVCCQSQLLSSVTWPQNGPIQAMCLCMATCQVEGRIQATSWTWTKSICRMRADHPHRHGHRQRLRARFIKHGLTGLPIDPNVPGRAAQCQLYAILTAILRFLDSTFMTTVMVPVILQQRIVFNVGLTLKGGRQNSRYTPSRRAVRPRPGHRAARQRWLSCGGGCIWLNLGCSCRY